MNYTSLDFITLDECNQLYPKVSNLLNPDYVPVHFDGMPTDKFIAIKVKDLRKLVRAYVDEWTICGLDDRAEYILNMSRKRSACCLNASAMRIPWGEFSHSK